MRTVLEGTSRRAVARLAHRARNRRQPRRRGAAARSAGLIGAIVAGGASRRFGGIAKGLELVGRRRIIDRVADALRVTVSEIVIISNEPDATSWIPGVPVWTDVRSERASIVGIHTALARATDTVITVAWDMPFVSADLLQMIRDRARNAMSAVVPVTAKGPHPLCAAYTLACRDTVERAIAAGALRLSSLIERLPSVDYIREDELAQLGDPQRMFFNVNTAADLEAAEAMAGD